MLLSMLARRQVQEGTLEILHATGRRTVVGKGAPHFVVRLHDPWLDWSLLANPRLDAAKL
jgi:hypothetical protein